MATIVVEQIFPALTWRIRHVTMYPEQSLEFVKLENDFDGIHFGLYLNHELTGVVSLFIQGHIGQFRKLAILPEAQNQGLGQKLMHYLIDFCKLQKVSLIWCYARANAKEFYFRLGFKGTDQTHTTAGFDYIRMELEIVQGN